ncbi:MAG TPA: GNAT family N-acetyltransferase [Candidatus Acidoferrum sp.]|nr:GNAT family N-acetyltransferase [Candidatus Acidoferrum sp.]
MSDLKIRRAACLDVDRIVELRLLLQHHVEVSNSLGWRITDEGKKLLKQNVENDLAENDICVLLAEADGKIIGYVQGEVTSRSDYLPRTVGHVSLIYVMKKFRRKGVGKRLMQDLCKFFNLNKAEHLSVRYMIGNVEAEGFWTKLGFEPIITTSATYAKELDFKLKSTAR